jgi:nitrile hydratase
MSYQSHADLGGRPIGGAIIPEPEGEIFHAAWEARVLALTLAIGASGQWNIDISRAARETLPNYAALSYYEIWFAALQRLLQQRGLVQADELAAGHALHRVESRARVVAAADVG